MTKIPPIKQELPFRPPYEWDAVLAFFRGHQLPEVESVDDLGFERVIETRNGLGWFRVERKPDRQTLSLTVWNAADGDLEKISTSVRRMFDVDANPARLLQAMSADSFLSGFWAQHPGLRLARAWNASESLFSTVLGQLVSVAFGRVLIGELMHAAGSVLRHPKTGHAISMFPSAEQVAAADLSTIRTSEARRATIRLVAEAILSGVLPVAGPTDAKSLRKALRNIPGVGAWTVEYVAMRGFEDDDSFPATDYALKQELGRHPSLDVNSVRPYRSYAAIALWRSFAEAK